MVVHQGLATEASEQKYSSIANNPSRFPAPMPSSLQNTPQAMYVS